METNSWVIDSHVHLHPNNLTPLSLIALCESLHSVAPTRDGARRKMAWCLADLPTTDTIDRIQDPDFDAALQDADVRTQVDDAGNLELRSADWSLSIINGEQIVTEEGLEILAIGGKFRLSKPESLTAVIERCLAKKFVPVLPWGVGKWLGRRGRIVGELIESKSYCRSIALADNGTRPVFWRYPALLRRATGSGYAVLHGSDSLSVANDQARTGHNGVVINDAKADDALSAIRSVVEGSNTDYYLFGRSMRIAHFVHTQAALRLERKK